MDDIVPIEPKNVARHELIGLTVTIVKSKDPLKLGINGLIIDETKKTLKIRTKDNVVITPKEDCSFELQIPTGQKIEIDGKILHGRAEERIKKKLPKKWDIF